jgi:hypothetical protein
MTQKKSRGPALFLYTAALAIPAIFNLATEERTFAQDITVLIDEASAKADLLGNGKMWVTVNVPAVNGTYRIIGHGHDTLDDGDSFNINVAGGTYSLSVVDDACCTTLESATTNAKTGGEPAGEFKWFTDAPNGGGISDHQVNSTGFSFSQNPLDSATNPTASFRAFFGTTGRAGTYWVDIVVSGASESATASGPASTKDVPAPVKDAKTPAKDVPPADVAESSPAVTSKVGRPCEGTSQRFHRRFFRRWRRR